MTRAEFFKSIVAGVAGLNLFGTQVKAAPVAEAGPAQPLDVDPQGVTAWWLRDDSIMVPLGRVTQISGPELPLMTIKGTGYQLEHELIDITHRGGSWKEYQAGGVTCTVQFTGASWDGCKGDPCTGLAEVLRDQVLTQFKVELSGNEHILFDGYITSIELGEVRIAATDRVELLGHSAQIVPDHYHECPDCLHPWGCDMKMERCIMHHSKQCIRCADIYPYS